MKIEVKKRRRNITIRKLLKCKLIRITDLRLYRILGWNYVNCDNYYYFICSGCLQEHFLDSNLTKYHNHNEIRKKTKLGLLLCCACFNYLDSLLCNNLKEGAQE